MGEKWSIELLDLTAEELAAIYEHGITNALPLVGFNNGTESTNEARANVGLGPVDGGDAVPSIVNQPHERAVDWARERAGDLITQIEDNTRGMLRSTVTQAIEEGWGASELADEIKDSAGFSEARAMTIARTELVSANRQGAISAYRDSGVAYGKEWLTAGDDLVEDDCQENEDAGPIGFDEEFPNGDDPHPNCRCSVIPVMEPLDEGDEEA